ncbi:hypothetical protein [Paraburkholderia hayleyella]|uniref:hypothetical protein n=1 Tax=Paraburkholderia hayleyella TaxID=2152889 RepID=UPI0012913BFC|nr:hypothetical protein [Paraburkholderia hayleyella]
MNKTLMSMIAGALIPMASGFAMAAPSVQATQAAPVAQIDVFEPFVGVSTLEAPGIVKAVNQARRSVTVTDPQLHNEATFDIDPNGGNLAQIKRGSKVRLLMAREVILGLAKGSAGQTKISLPGNSESTLALIQSINHSSGVVVLQKADGSATRIKGRDPLKMASLQPGMQLILVPAPKVSVSVELAQ